MVVLGASTIMFFLSRTIWLLIIARALQGVSSAIVGVSGFSMIAKCTEPGQIGAAMGTVATGIAAGELAGPLVGGYLYDAFGHNAVFAVAISVVGFDLLLRLFMKEIPKAKRHLLPIKNNYGTVTETPPAEELIKQSTFRILLSDSRLLASLWSVIAASIIRTAFDSVLALYVMKHFGWSATGSGFVFLAMIAPNLVSPLIGAVVEKRGPRLITVLAFTVLIPLFVSLCSVVNDTTLSKVFFCIIIASIGLCFATISTTHTVAISFLSERLEQEHPGKFGGDGSVGQAFALFNSSWAVGMLIGPIWAAFVVDSLGWTAFCLSFSGLSLVSLFVAFRFCAQWELV
jgi:MFS family permease